MRRKGSAIMIAMILGTVFFIAVSALLRHSSGEMKHVRAVSAVKKAELLAMSGIDWAESELRVGRWYGTDFVPYEKNKGKHATYGKKTLTPFGSGEGEVTVICEDVANKVPGTNMHGMQELWFLHHINVYALGTYEGQQCLIYGRYIMSPEPILNSKSTDGADFASPEYGVPGAIGIPASKTNVNGEEISEYVVKQMNVAEYDSVDANTIIAILNPINDSDTDIEVRPHTFGTVAEIRIQPGQTCRAGDNLLLLTKTIQADGNDVTMKTLKKMVRITKIPSEVWQYLDIENRNDRYTLSQYISGISDAYLQNFVAHAALEGSLKNIGSDRFEKKMSASEVLEAFPAHLTSTTRNRAENTFLAHMIKNFTAPGGTWDKKEQALNKTFLKLDHPKTTQPPQELVNWLRDLGLENLLKTKPRIDSRYFDPKMKQDEFMDLLRPHLNQPSSEFIKNLSELPDASRLIEIEEGNFEDSSPVYSEDQNGIEIVKPDKGVRVTVEKVTKSYSFVDPESGFAIEMQDLMAFIKKYYDDEVCQSPREEIRNNEHTDWPLPAPAPAPPAPVPGGTWIWIEGTPGVPPGKPSYDHTNGSTKDINPPTAGSGGYEPQLPGDLDGGKKEWEIPGIPPTEGSEGGENPNDPNSENEPPAIKICDCNGGCCSKCNPEEKGKITVNVGGNWNVIPGTPGVDPQQGRYIWQPDPPPPPPGSEGDSGSGGDGSGGGDGTGSGSDGSGGGGGTPGYGNNSPSGNSGGSSNPSPPPSPPRRVSGAC